MKFLKYALIIIFLLCNLSPGQAREKITIFAAASTTDLINEITQNYAKNHQIKIITSFASSSILAKQIEHGAKADIYISANLKWADYLAKKQKYRPRQRRDLMQNKLVLISPLNHNIKISMEKTFQLKSAYQGRISLGDPRHVPAGLYAKQALQYFNWWDPARIAGAMDVRAALSYVERGECALGIVYQTDAMISKKVKIVGIFPPVSHDPITYPVILLNEKNKAARDFYEALFNESMQHYFNKYGFSPIKNSF